MADAAGKIVLKILTIAISIPVTRAVAKVVERAWLAARPDNPPRKPTEPRSDGPTRSPGRPCPPPASWWQS